MTAYISGRAVSVVHGEGATVYHVIDLQALEGEQPAILASYRDRWRAENHAITGCPCRALWHVYHGDRHEGEGDRS